MSFAHRIAVLCVAVAWQVSCTSGAHAIDYHESIQGDLSNNPAAPTSFGTLSPGIHTLDLGVVSGDYDLITFGLAPNTRLDSIFLNSYAGSTFSFSGIQSGPTWTAGLGFDVDPAPLLGWALFGEPNLQTELLDDYAQAEGAIGFAPPLPPGTYTLQFQETGSFPVTAQFTINVVPEPSTLTIAGLGIAALAALRRKHWVRRPRALFMDVR